MEKKPKKSEADIWNDIFKEVKEQFSGNIEFKGNVPQFTGTHCDRRITVIPKGNTITFQVPVKSVFTFNLGVEGTLGNIGKTFSREITIGESEFDARYVIRGNPPAAVIEFLSFRHVRDAIRCFDPFDRFEIKNDFLTIVSKSSNYIKEKMAFLIERAAFLAKGAENPDEIEGEDEENAGAIYVKKQDEVEGLTMEQRVLNLEKKVKELEKEIEVLKAR